MHNISSRFLKSDTFAAFLILLGGFTAFAIIVIADTASTSVTVGNAAPTVSSLSLNGGNNITLNENSFTWASSSMTVSDSNGCSTITSVTAKMYLASTSNSGTLCTYDGNSCYTSTCVATTTGNQCTGGADTSVQYDCGFRVWYIANATDSSAPVWSSSIWSVSATSTDGTDNGNATNTAQTIEINTLNALSVTSSIGYPATAANADTGATNQTVTITNTGNVAIDSEISGDVMCTDYPGCSSGQSFGPTQQKFGLTDVTYSSLSNTLAATTTPDTVEVVLIKPTSTTTAVTDDTYWGIAIPVGQAAGSYTGQNTFTAVAD